MPHYRDGTEAGIGDYVIGKNWDGSEVVGRVQSITPGSTTCNMSIAYFVPGVVPMYGTFTCGEFAKVTAPATAEPVNDPV